MKIFEFRIGDEKEWVCGETQLDAMKEEYSTSCMSIMDIDEIVEIPESEWGNYEVINEDGKTVTFKEYMEDVKSAQIIANTVDWDREEE